MKRSVLALQTVLLVCLLLVDDANRAAAQPALEKLEALIRGQRDDSPPAEPNTKEPAVTPTAEQLALPPEQTQPPDSTQPPEKTKPKSVDPTRGYLGIVADDRTDRGRGVRILEILPGGPADRAGLKPQDLITKLGDFHIRQMSEMEAILQVVPIGGTIPFEVLRDGKSQRIDVALGTRPPAEKRKFKTLAPPPEDLPTVPKVPLSPRQVPADPPLAPSGEAARPTLGDWTQINRLENKVEQLELRIGQLDQRIRTLERALAARVPNPPEVGQPPKTASPSGRVTLDGKPLPGAQVTFVPEDQNEAVATGVTDAHGTFTTSIEGAGHGALPGVYRVFIAPAEPEKPGRAGLLPRRYGSSDTSKLLIKVEPGVANQFEFDLAE